MSTRMMMRLCRRHLSSVDFATKSEVKRDFQELGDKIDKLAEAVTALHSKMDASIDGLHSKMDASIDRLHSKMNDLSLSTDAKIDGITKRLGEVESKLDKQVGESKALKIMIGNVASGLGIKFEKFNRSWLKRFLNSKGVSTEDIESNRTEYGLEGVAEVEIDLYCHKPPIIMECTSFLGKNEIGKVERLALVRRALEKRHNVRFECLLSHMGIHKDILKKVLKICKDENIELIGDYELPEG